MHEDSHCTVYMVYRALVEGASSTDKTFVPVEGGYHEVLFEEGGDQLAQGMIDWILARAKNSNGSGGAAKM